MNRYYTTLYSPDLRDTWIVPRRERFVSQSFPRSATIGEWDRNHWAAFRLSPEMPLIREGSGQLLAVSDDVIVVRRDNTVRVEDHSGRLLGSIPVPPKTSGAPIAEVAGPGRLYLDFDNSHRIVDFSGKQIISIPRPPGWGFRHGWSSNGNRMLFDHYTRTGSLLERTIDRAGSVLVPVPEEPNGEAITVIDTTTGSICFRMESHASLFGEAGQIHADIAPSGRLVGVATPTTFTVYSLPETCSGQ
jgi:hypothetical protein